MYTPSSTSIFTPIQGGTTESKIPIQLIEDFIDFFLQHTPNFNVEIAFLQEAKVRWQSLFNLSQEFIQIIQDLEGNRNQNVPLFPIPDGVRDQVHSLLDRAETGTLRSLFIYMKGRVDATKEK